MWFAQCTGSVVIKSFWNLLVSWFTIQLKFFQTAACIVKDIGVVVIVKPTHDDIEHDPGAFTSDHLDDAIDPLL